MRKIYQIIVLFAISIALASCGDVKQSASESDSYSGDINEQYHKACAAADFETAHSILASLHAQHLKSMTDKYKSEQYSWEECSEGEAQVQATATAYLSAVQFIFTSEARTIIAENENPENKITYLYTEILQVGTKRNSIPEFFNDTEKCLQSIYDKYVECVNGFSNSVLDLAINAGNKRLAAIAVSHFLDIHEGFEEEEVGGELILRYSDKERVAAQEKLNNAVKNGLFDN